MTLDDQITEGYHQQGVRTGVLEVICGSMFSGKTEELMRRIKRALIARLKVVVFKPVTDTRYHATNVVSHDKNSIPSIPISNSAQMLDLIKDADVVGIDEAQFIDNGIIALMSIADRVTKVHAVCMDCGAPANFSYRLGDDDRVVVLGAMKEYACLCRSCYLARIKKTAE